jgi:hypothetical protein
MSRAMDQLRFAGAEYTGKSEESPPRLDSGVFESSRMHGFEAFSLFTYFRGDPH